MTDRPKTAAWRRCRDEQCRSKQRCEADPFPCVSAARYHEPAVPAIAKVAVALFESRSERIERLMHILTWPVPSTKGLPPADRANFLHAELERRIAIAKEALS